MSTLNNKARKHRGHVSAGHGRAGKHTERPGGRGLTITTARTWTSTIPATSARSVLDTSITSRTKTGSPSSTLTSSGASSLKTSARSKSRMVLLPTLLLSSTSSLTVTPNCSARVAFPAFPSSSRLARYVSAEAERKTKEAGGAIQLVA